MCHIHYYSGPGAPSQYLRRERNGNKTPVEFSESVEMLTRKQTHPKP